jgi:hypothetical protein
MERFCVLPDWSAFSLRLTPFSGKVTEGLVLHPDNEHILFPLGTTIVLRHIISRTQNFLRGHDNDISVIAVSNSGKYIASGQKTYSGFQVCNRVNSSDGYLKL